MTMPIQRQSEAYGAFDDGLRFQRDYTTHDLPPGLVNALGGPRIHAGLLNTRTAGPAMDLGGGGGTPPGAAAASGTASATPGLYVDLDGNEADNGGPGHPPIMPHVGVNTDSMDPASHAYAEPPSWSPYDSANGTRHWDPNTGYQPSEHDEWLAEQPDVDDESGYNWGPEPHTGPPETGEGEMPLQPADQFIEQHHPDDFAHYHNPPEPLHLGNAQVDYDNQFSPHLASFGEARRQVVADGGPGNSTEDLDGSVSVYGGEHSAAAAVTPQVVPGWVGHGYSPGHRVGLPWREQLIPGTVTHLHGQQLGVRWDDGQHSTEEPSDLRPL